MIICCLWRTINQYWIKGVIFKQIRDLQFVHKVAILCYYLLYDVFVFASSSRVISCCFTAIEYVTSRVVVLILVPQLPVVVVLWNFAWKPSCLISTELDEIAMWIVCSWPGIQLWSDVTLNLQWTVWQTSVYLIFWYFELDEVLTHHALQYLVTWKINFCKKRQFCSFEAKRSKYRWFFQTVKHIIFTIIFSVYILNIIVLKTLMSLMIKISFFHGYEYALCTVQRHYQITHVYSVAIYFYCELIIVATSSRKLSHLGDKCFNYAHYDVYKFD